MKPTPPPPARPDAVTPADLESRQDELLRLLDDLEARTKQALARLTPTTQPAVQEASPGKRNRAA